MKEKHYLPMLNIRQNLFFLMFLFCLINLSGRVQSQSTGSNSSFNFETGIGTVTACGGPAAFRIKLTAVVALSGNSISVTMPAGVEYVPTASGGGLTIPNGTGTVSEGSISNLAAPVFTIGDLAVGQVLEFTYAVKATCGIIPYVEALNVPANSYVFSATSPAKTENFQTVGFNVLYGVPSIIDVLTNNVSTAGYAGNIGDIVDRKVLIKNGGNGAITTATYLDLDGTYTYSTISGPYSTGATLAGSRLALSTAAFGGDGIWSPDETITVSYKETITSCPEGTPSRNIYAGYGCNSAECKVTQTKATQVSTPFLPNLDIKLSVNYVKCPGEAPYIGTVTIVNRGQGIAKNFYLEGFGAGRSSGIFDQNFYLDTTSTSYTRNGGASQHLYARNWQNLSVLASNRLCNPGVTSQKVNYAQFNLGDIAPGDSLVVTIVGNTCLSTLCQEVKGTLVNVTGNWIAGCSNTVNSNRPTPIGPGISPTGALVGISDNGAVKISGNNQPFNIGMSYTNWFTNNITDGGYLDICVTIPDGLILNDAAVDSYVIRNVKDVTVIWRPVSHSRSGNTVCYRFNHASLGDRSSTSSLYYRLFTYSGIEQHFLLSQDCASGSGILPLSFTYTTKNTDGCSLEHVLNCYERNIVSLCPGDCPVGGLTPVETDARRLNYGLPDNNDDGDADLSGTINMGRVSTTLYMLGDTMRYTYTGLISAAGDLATYPLNTQFEYAYLNVGIPTAGTAASFELLGTAAVVVTKQAGDVVSCTIPATASVADFQLQLNSCPALAGYVFQPGDQVAVEQLLRAKSIIGQDNQTIVVTSSYASHSANPPADTESRFTCSPSYDRYRLAGVVVTGGSGFVSIPCEGKAVLRGGTAVTIIKSSTSSVGYAYENAFPFEHRNFANSRKIKYVLPAGFAYDPSYAPTIRILDGPQDSSWDHTFPMSPPVQSGDTLIFDVSIVYTTNGGTVSLPDEGYTMESSIGIKVLCNAPAGDSFARFETNIIPVQPEVARLLAAATLPYGTAPNNSFSNYSGGQFNYYGPGQLTFFKFPLNLSSISTVSNSEDGTVSYRVRLSNDTTVIQDNVWLHSENSAITITEIKDEAFGTVYLPNANGFFELGSYAAGQARNYTLKGVLDNCEDVTGLIYAGSCGAYPTSLANTCSKDTLQLTAHPGETDFQAILTGPNREIPLCDDADFSFEVKASKSGNVKDVSVNFLLPAGSSIVPGSVQYSYPVDAVAVSAPDPLALTGTAAFNVSGYSTQLTSVGLRGVGTIDPDSSEVRVSFKVTTDCSFTPGARFRAQYNAKDACGNSLDARANTADLAIPGLGALPYRTTVLLVTADTAHCADTPTKLLVNITNVLGGTATGSNDSVYVELPPNVSFSSYSYAVNGGDYLNAPTSAPNVYGISGGYTRLAWLLPAGIPSGGSINFPLTYSLDSGAGICDLDSIHAYTGVVNSSYCSKIGRNCDVLFLNSTVPGKTVPYYQPEIGLSYAMDSYCITDPNPVPVLSGCGSSQSGGTYSASPAGLSIDVTTGEIDPVGSLAGTYLITYTIPSSGSSCLVASDTMSVTVKGESCPFPVVLLDFKARVVESSVELSWRTVREDNSDRFEVEHSVDGKYWSNLGRVAAKGSSNADVRYNFRDSSPMSGQNVYRLKIVDRDGSYGYSRLQSVRVESDGASSVYPNPVSDKLTLGLSDFGKVTGVELHDLGGRRVYSSGSKPSREINVKNLSPGMYLVSVRYTGGMVRTFKVVVNH